MTWRADHVSATRGTGGNFMGEGEAIRVSDGQPSGSSDRRFGAAPRRRPAVHADEVSALRHRPVRAGRRRPAEQGSRTRPGRRDGGRGSCVRSRRGRGLRRDVGPSAAPAASRASAARGLPPQDLAKPVPPLRPVYDPFSARRRQTPNWLVRYTASLAVGDLAAVVLAAIATVAVVGTTSDTVAAALALVLIWPALLAMSGAYAERRLGAGADEFRRVLLAGLLAVALLSTAVVAFSLPGLRGLRAAGCAPGHRPGVGDPRGAPAPPARRPEAR